MMKIFKWVLFTLSIFCLCVSMVMLWKQYKPNKYQFIDFESMPTVDIKPSYITYNQFSLPVTTKKIESGRWPVSDDSLVYLDGSGILGQTGNAVIYGHNWPNLLGFLKSVKPGETIKTFTHDNKSYAYVVEYVAEVTPDQVHILTQGSDSRLTIYTCSGFLDTKRLVVVAKLVP